MLFFFAGFEIDFQRIKGTPLRLAAAGVGTLARARLRDRRSAGGRGHRALARVHRIGARHDGDRHAAADPAGRGGAAHALRHVPAERRSGRRVRADPPHHARALVARAACTTPRSSSCSWRWRCSPRSSRCGRSNTTWGALERSIESSGQAAVRVAVLLVFGMVALASELGLDILLGGFVAGIITRLALKGPGDPRSSSRSSPPSATASSSRSSSSSAACASTWTRSCESPGALAKMFLFFGLFLVVRGVPALLLYRKVLDGRDRAALAFFSATQLPLVVAITTIARRGRRDARVDVRRARRRGDPLDDGLPARRAAPAQGPRRARPREPWPTTTPTRSRPERPVPVPA